MGTTKRGSQIEHGETEVAMASGSAPAKAVTFRQAFTGIPKVFVVPHLGDESASLAVSNESETGFTLTVTGSGLPDGDTPFEWVAHEKT